MKRRITACLFLLLPLLVYAQLDGAGPVSSVRSNNVPVPLGWLQVPSREVILDVRHQFLDPSGRRDAGEFVITVLSLLLNANYTVRLSDEYILDEINYYSANLAQETPPEMCKAILDCLEKTRASAVLDWNSFRQIPRQGTELVATQRHLPWMAPPVKATAIQLAGTNTTCPRLQLKLLWSSQGLRGAVQYNRRPGTLSYPQETVLVHGRGTLWRFAAVVRLETGGQTSFLKVYPACEWQKSYIGSWDLPVLKLTQAIAADLNTGLKAKPLPVSTTGTRKSRTSKKTNP